MTSLGHGVGVGPWHAKYAGLKTSKPALVTKHGTAAVVLAEDNTSWTAGSPALSSKDMFAWPIHPGWACVAPLEGYLLNDLSAVQLGQSVFLLCPFIFLRFSGGRFGCLTLIAEGRTAPERVAAMTRSGCMQLGNITGRKQTNKQTNNT